MRLDCKLTPEELAERGVKVGSPACVARSRKAPVYLQDYVAGYALDDKAGVAALLLTAELVGQEGKEGAAEVFIVLTSMEEAGAIGASYGLRALGLDAVVALDVAPVAPEYPIQAGPTPAVIFKDSSSIYSYRLSQFVAQTAEQVVGSVQRMVARSYGSDASLALRAGMVPQAALLAFPTENTHGFEVAHLGGLVNCARVLAQVAHSVTEVFGHGG
jgi:putative aminopeptidase FrvX